MRAALTCLALIVITGCTAGPIGSSGNASPPALPSSASSIDECQPLTTLPCVDQAVQVSVPVAGTGASFVYRSDRVPGRTASPALDVTAQKLGGWTFSVVHAYDPKAQLLIQGDGSWRHVAALPVQSGKYSGKLAIASVDGRQVFVFDSSGRQVATLDALTGAVEFTFTRDPSGLLTAVHDRNGDVIGLTRDSKGALTAITLPNGGSLGVVLDGDGYLSSLMQPGLRTDSFTYAHGGLLTSHSLAAGASSFYAYDDQGLLTSVTEPGGVTASLSREQVTGGYSIAVRSSSGRTATYTVTQSGGTITRKIDDGAGTAKEEISVTTRKLMLADGTTVGLEIGPDPRFGMQSPVVVKQTTTSASGRSSVITETRRFTGGGDELASAQVSDQFTVDGKPFTTAFDPGSRTITTTDADGVRTTSSLDSAGRISKAVAGGVTTQYAYDKHGRIVAITVGSGSQTRKSKVEYDDASGQVTVTDATGVKTVIADDSAGRPSLFSLPGSTAYSLLYDATGHLVQLQTAGGAQVLTYSPRGQLTSQWSPATAGGATGSALAYDDDGLVTSVTQGTLPPVAMQRDPGGRLTSVQTAGGPLTATFVGGSSVPSTLTGPGGVQLTRQVDGEIVTSESWSGPVSGQVTLTVDGRGRITGVSTGGTTLPLAYDGAGHLAKSGDVTFAYDKSTGLLQSESLANLVLSYKYDAFGQPASANAGTAFTQAWKHDDDGRITEVDESLGGATTTHTYTYDALARLLSDASGGSTTNYAYDADGNLVRVAGPQGTVTFNYDAADRLTKAGAETFAYASDGSLSTRRGPSGTTTYAYDSRGALTAVTLADGRRIQYVTDALGRRIGRLLNGQMVYGFLWAGQRPVAYLDGNGAIVERFTYDATGRLVELTLRGTAYRVITDANGSVRAVLDGTGGAPVQVIDYDAYGNVISDSNPGFQPFGFAGGIYDRDTGLVRIGSRDYDAGLRRWTAPDPIGLAGGQPNLYAYVFDDPVNFRDPSGRYGQPVVTTTYGFGVQGTAILGTTGGTIGIGAQNTGGHWGIYANYGQGAGVDFGVGITGNAGNVYSPSSDPTNDWTGPTNSGGGNIGPYTGGYYQSPNLHNGNGDPSYEGFYAGGSAGLPLGGSTTSTNTVCLAGCGSSHGDPHNVSADGLAFDYQGAGEYLALTSTKGDMDVQVRQQPRASNLQVSISTALAVNVAGDHVGVYAFDPALPARPSLYVNGQPNFSFGKTTLPHGGVLNVDATQAVITWPDGSYLVVRKVPVVNIDYFLAPSRKGTVSGLWGAYSGDAAQDLVTRAGQVLPPPANGIVNPSYGDGWRISQSQSIFDDDPGKDVAHYTNRKWGTTPATPSSLPAAARARATAICTGAGLRGLSLTDCILDVGATGDPSFASMEASSAVVHPQIPDVYDIAIGEQVVPDGPGPGAGQITRPDQIQIYKFYSDANRTIYVSTDTPCSGDVSLSLYTPGGSNAIDSIGCKDDIGRAILHEAGVWSIRASVFGATPLATYAFTIHPASGDEEFSIKPGDQIAPDQPQAGQGRIAALGSRQLYTFTLAAPQTLYLERGATCTQSLQWALVPRDRVNGTYGEVSTCSDWGRLNLTPGVWTIEVEGTERGTGPFSFGLLIVPADQTYQVSIGDTISGHLDSPGSRALYFFSGTPGQLVNLDTSGGCGANRQIEYRITTPDDLDSGGGYLTTCLSFDGIKLPQGGRYVVEVQALDDTGTFTLKLTAA